MIKLFGYEIHVKKVIEEKQISIVGHNKDELIELCETALRNSIGVYKALRLVGADKCLPGLKGCEDNCEKAIKAISNYYA